MCRATPHRQGNHVDPEQKSAENWSSTWTPRAALSSKPSKQRFSAGFKAKSGHVGRGPLKSAMPGPTPSLGRSLGRIAGDFNEQPLTWMRP